MLAKLCPRRSQKQVQCSLLCIVLHKKKLKVHLYINKASATHTLQRLSEFSMINIHKDRRGVFIWFFIKGVQQLDGDSSGNCCNWLEIGLGTVTNRSPTNSVSNFNWSVASAKINRVHPLTMVNTSAKFDKEIHNG